MCRSDTRVDFKRVFVNEINVMKQISLHKHENIVNLLHTDFSKEPMMVVVE